jgi:uroporphyrinogen-III synthase
MACRLMRVLITRPEEDAKPLAEMLRQRGYETIVSPLMRIRLCDGPEIPLNGIQAIVATSANAIRALQRRTARRDVRVFAVGTHTAEVALVAGFADVRQGSGDSHPLAIFVRKAADPASGPLLWIAGRDRTAAFAGALTARGFEVQVQVLYAAEEASALTEEAAAALSTNRIDAVLLFSPRSASVFAKVVQNQGLLNGCRRMVALCMSQAVAQKLSTLPFANILIAQQPNVASMLDLLGQPHAEPHAS